MIKIINYLMCGIGIFIAQEYLNDTPSLQQTVMALYFYTVGFWYCDLMAHINRKIDGGRAA